ncbi:MAG: hypothetical protein VZT48_04000 [Bulleidia sp.]|nr:hypothetical protein [Bulleidia sp.]
MIERHYNPQQRRALNMVWNACGRYGEQPPFMAFLPDGSADFYFNMIIGLSMKYLDQDQMRTFYASYSGSRKASTFDGVVWLALENYLYEKEVKERPVLTQLRKEHANAFFRQAGTLSRQQQMLSDTTLLEQQNVRWCRVLGRKDPFLTPKARKLAGDLEYTDTHADLDLKERTDECISGLQDILINDFHFSNFNLSGERPPMRASGPLKDLLDRTMRHEVHQTDSLLLRNDFGDEGGSKEGKTNGMRSNTVLEKSDADRDYIEGCFGKCCLNEKEMAVLENDLCKGNHEDCRLWVTKGHELKGKARTRELQDIAEQTQKQNEFNLAYLNQESILIASSIRKLSAELNTLLATYMQPLPEKAKAGSLQPEKAWRLGVVYDPYVFERPGDTVENHLTVDLLLDASSSRMRNQEKIAAQAYILAESLTANHIPVKVTAFHSLRGYTVLQILKDYDEHDCRRIFRYFAAGWNRDGLALNLVHHLMRKGGQEARRIMLVMTDANPDDSQKMPAKEGSIFLREYANAEGVEDTIESVKALKEDNVAVGAVYMGPNTHLENVHAIYGSQYIRVQKVQQLAEGISSLLQMMLREMKN